MPSRTAVAVSLAAFACLALAAVALWGFGGQGAPKADDGVPGPARVASEAQPAGAEPQNAERQSRGPLENERDRAAAPAERSVAAAHGRVVNQDGVAVAGALVHLVPTGRSAERVAPASLAQRQPNDVLLGRSDAAGRFELAPHPAAGAPGAWSRGERLRLAVRAPGYAPLERVLPAGLMERDLGLYRLVPGRVLQGRVLTAEGAPVAGAELFALDPENRAAAVPNAESGERLGSSGADGGFLLDGLAEGPWRVLVTARGHADAVFSGERAGSPEEPLSKDLVLAPSATVTGTLIGAGEELATLEVRASPIRFDGVGQQRGITTGTLRGAPIRPAAPLADGTFTLEGLTPGERYRVAAYGRGATSLARPRSDAIEVTAGARGVRLTLIFEAAVRFQLPGEGAQSWVAVLLDEDDPARPARLLSIDAPRGPESPASEHEFPVFRVEPHRPLTLVVLGSASEPIVRTGIRLGPGQRPDLGLLDAKPGARVVLEVVDEATGAPLAGVVARTLALGPAADPSAPAPPVRRAIAALSEASAPWLWARTDAQGRAELSGLATTGATLELETATETHGVTLTPGELAAGASRVRL